MGQPWVLSHADAKAISEAAKKSLYWMMGDTKKCLALLDAVTINFQLFKLAVRGKRLAMSTLEYMKYLGDISLVIEYWIYSGERFANKTRRNLPQALTPLFALPHESRKKQYSLAALKL